MLESRIKENILEALRKRGARPVKQYGCIYTEAGMPDLLICYKGRFICMELKRPGEKPTKKQLQVLRSFTRAEATIGIACSVDEAMNILDSIDNFVLTPV